MWVRLRGSQSIWRSNLEAGDGGRMEGMQDTLTFPPRPQCPQPALKCRAGGCSRQDGILNGPGARCTRSESLGRVMLSCSISFIKAGLHTINLTNFKYAGQ